MNLKIWPFVGCAFCSLLVLVALSVWEVLHKLHDLDSHTAQVHLAYETVDNALTDIRASVYRSSLSVSELPPNPTPAQSEELRKTLSDNRAVTVSTVKSIEPLMDEGQRNHLNRLRHELSDFWDSQRQFVNSSNSRERILYIAEQIDDLNTANVDRQERDIEQRASEFQAFLKQIGSLLMFLSVAISASVTFYLSRMEREAAQQKLRAESAESELRRLSNQLVNAQEEERKSISRELHDEVGQILTGLRLELASLQPETSHQGAFAVRLDSVKALAEQALRSVRNLAMLLRPSMLDDLGLPAALRWQAKEFSRRTGVDAVVRITGPFDNLPDTHRTCLYRVIQEATTNIARHANAKHVVITLSESGNLLIASVQDDGHGFSRSASTARGLGLVGMEERVRELQGRLAVESQPGNGTLVRVELPVPEGTYVKAG